ncbi:hypothetical protein VT85_16395 [Planctomyces sp. SH-PL62]|nr:hypothetical protein VT85_16395 [Planctomyces sp. SH-PL62]
MISNNRVATASLRNREGTAGAEPTPAPAYRVGERFLPDRTSWPEGAQYGYGGCGHSLTVFTPAPGDRLIEDVRQGDARFALTVIGPLFFLAYRFGESVVWSDVPYVWHLQHSETRAVPPRDGSPETRALLWISLVGTDDGLIHAQRGVTLSPGFTRALHDAIRDQANSTFDPLECTLSMAEANRERASVGQRIQQASAWTKGNS